MQPGVKFVVQRLELIPDLLLGLAQDLPAQPLPIRPEAIETAPIYRFLSAVK